jgi:hypothetical protein
VAKYEPSKDEPGKLTRATGTRLVGKCSDHKDAVTRWQEAEIKKGGKAPDGGDPFEGWTE